MRADSVGRLLQIIHEICHNVRLQLSISLINHDSQYERVCISMPGYLCHRYTDRLILLISSLKCNLRIVIISMLCDTQSNNNNSMPNAMAYNRNEKDTRNVIGEHFDVKL